MVHRPRRPGGLGAGAARAPGGRRGFMLRDYTARELTVGPGAEVAAGETMAGWTWVTTTDGRSGWVPNTALAAS
jgi:hypothetical protein